MFLLKQLLPAELAIVQRSYRRRRAVIWATSGVVGAVWLTYMFTLFATQLGGMDRVFAVWIGVVVIAGITSLVVWTCPRCGGQLGRRLNPSRCPACDVELRSPTRQASSATLPHGDEMSSFKEQTRAVNSVLFQHWDPIGVRAMEGPDSEYMSYVPQLIGLAQRGASDLELADFLGGVEHGAMGLSISPLAKRLDVASRIKRELRRGSDAREG